jgi:ketosteroid isomerase-like protein
MTETSVKSFVESLHRHRKANDIEGCLAHFSPDATFRMAGSAAASRIAGRYQGTAALRQILSALIADWEWQSANINSITSQDDRVAIHFHLTAVFKPKQAPVDTEIVDILTLRDGKITSFVEFVDTALVAQITG